MPYSDFEVRRLKADGTSPLITYDQFKPTVFFNSAKQVNKNFISFPVKFNHDEDHHVYIVKKKTPTESEKAKSLTQAKANLNVDTSVARDPNFLPASLGQTLKYGEKELKYLGLIPGEKVISHT